MMDASAVAGHGPAGGRSIREALRLLRDELTLTPDRWSRMLRMTTLVALVVVVSNALRVPDLGLSAYMIFFFSKPDVVTTVRTGIAAIVGLTLVLALAFVVYASTLGEPALRVLAMSCAIFAGFYLVRSSPLGPLGFLIGLVISYALALVNSNASPEKLTRGLLWIWVAIAYPVALIIASDLVLGRRPDELFRRGVSSRLTAAGAWLAGGAGRSRRELERLDRMGTEELAAWAKAGPAATTRTRLLAQIDLLFLLLRELPSDATSFSVVAKAVATAGEACGAAGHALLAGGQGASRDRFTAWETELVGRAEVPGDLLAVVLPLLSCAKEIDLLVDELREARSALPGAEPHAEAIPAPPPNKTEAVQFALKVTLAAMAAYILYTSLDWSGIHTAMLTCFIVAQDSAGATLHKLTLRIVGAIIGAALGIGSIVFVLPYLETVGGLVVLVAAVTLLAAWVATASETISYAGWQMAFAFYLTVLQGFTRTSKMVVGRDRVIGIVVGNLIISLVFITVWPVWRKTAVRRALGRAVQFLADALRLQPGRALDAELSFRTELQKVKQAQLAVTFERDARDLAPSVRSVESIFVPVHALVHRPPVSDRLSQATETVAQWLSDFAAAIPAERPTPPFPAPADLPAVEENPQARLGARWLELLEDRVSRLAAKTRPAAATKGTP
jgi:multidrug resistance protein MdtO